MDGNLGPLDENDLRDRLNVILERLDTLYRQIGPVLRDVGNLRLEADMIFKELKKRGVLPDVPGSTVQGEI